jgi:hypothetical protein
MNNSQPFKVRNFLYLPHALTFILSAVCLPTSPLPLPKRVLHRMRSSASFSVSGIFSFPWGSSSNCLCFLPQFPYPSIFVNLNFGCIIASNYSKFSFWIYTKIQNLQLCLTRRNSQCKIKIQPHYGPARANRKHLALTRILVNLFPLLCCGNWLIFFKSNGSNFSPK